MNSTPIVYALFISVLFVKDSMQYVASTTCFGQPCPQSTTNCKEHKQSSTDKSRIQIQITCLDEFDASLKEYYFEEPSHLDRYTFYQNTRYESINQGISRRDPSRLQTLDLTPRHQRPEYY